MLAAGRLNQLVTLKQKQVTRDGMGAQVVSWVTVATVWAAVEPLRGREFVALRAAHSELTAKITIRHRAGIVPEMRVEHGTSVYEIAEVIDPRARGESLELMCSAPTEPT
mgnify:CR=1 FL=1